MFYLFSFTIEVAPYYYPVGDPRARLHFNVEDMVYVRLKLLPDRVQLCLERIALERANHVGLGLFHILHVAGPFDHLHENSKFELLQLSNFRASKLRTASP